MVDQFGVSAKGKQNRRRAQEGRGTGRGRAYKPQLRVQDVASKGRSTRMPVDGRMAHLLSDLEARLALNLRWSPHISNVREQVPLPLEHTIAIAEQMGIAHPKVRGDSAPLVLTTDLVADYDDGKLAVVCARSVKPASALDLRNGGRPDSARVLTRTIAILEIERRFWQSQGADWRLVCEHDSGISFEELKQLGLSDRARSRGMSLDQTLNHAEFANQVAAIVDQASRNRGRKLRPRDLGGARPARAREREIDRDDVRRELGEEAARRQQESDAAAGSIHEMPRTDPDDLGD